jgi:sirohydrochlorin cobaltochelatase
MCSTRSPCPPAPATDADLLLVGHGATAGGGGAPALAQHADRLRKRRLFHSVQAAALYGGTTPEAALQACRASRVYVVPMFMCAGNYVRRVVPQRLGLDRPEVAARLCYGEAIGTHPRLAAVVGARVDAARRAQGAAPSATTVVLVAHGSTREPASAAAARDCAACLAGRDGYAAIHVAFLDEPPHLDAVLPLAATPLTVVVGLFMEEGRHAGQDLRQLLGLTGTDMLRVRADGSRVVYTGAIGAAPGIGSLILERVAEAAATRLPGLRSA